MFKLAIEVCFENHFGLIHAIFLSLGSSKSVYFFGKSGIIIISNTTWPNARTTHANFQTLTKSLRQEALSLRIELFRVMLIFEIL